MSNPLFPFLPEPKAKSVQTNGIKINLPKGGTPNPESPHYAGLLALFAYPRRGATFSLAITDVARELQRRNLVTRDSNSVTFVPAPEEIAELQRTGRSVGPVRFRRVTITSE